MKVVAFFHLKEVRWALPEDDRLRLERRLPGVTITSIDDPADLPAALADAEVFAGWQFPRQHFEAAKRLRWVHSASAGVEANLFPALIASDVVLTNSTGLHAVSIPEHVLGQMLVLARNFHEAARLQQRAGGIAGAALDVFKEEPLPSNHPFWSLPNLVLTPHISGYTAQYFQKVVALFEDNLDRFVGGRRLRNVVDKQLGYVRQEE